MSYDTRIYPEEREPKAIKIRKPGHKKRNIIISVIVGILIIGLGALAWYLFNNGILALPETDSESEETSSVIEEPAASESSSSEEEPEIIPESSSEPEPIIESEPEPIVEPEPEQNIIPKDEWYMLLVNKQNPVDESFAVETKQIDNAGHAVDARIYDDLMAMFTAGENEGLHFSISTAYRSYSKQKSLFEQGKTTAAPGTSEHNCGLALDIVSEAGEFEGSPEQSWLLKHAHEYGFILRYPEGKENVTGFAYEPWHFRYVGKEQAKLINESGLCFEEYLAQ